MFGFIKKAVAELFIASPADSTPLLIWRYPDRSIPNGAKLTVRADEVAVFFREGQVVGVLQPGPHTLTTSHVPFLGDLLISPLTGDNHFITEIFFVRVTEHLHATGPRAIGSYTDSASRLLIQLGFTARYSVRVRDPVAVITRLAGMREDASANVASFLDGRVASLLAACVGALAAQHSIVELVSNQYGEQLGQYVIEQARRAFEDDGIELRRFLELHLAPDEGSRASLADYARQASSLQLQREGAELATRPGFAQFHLVQGQRALLEGMAQKGAVMPMLAPVIMPGMMSAIATPQLNDGPRSSTVATRLEAPPRWYLRLGAGAATEGPYPARHVALRIIASGEDEELARVRGEGSDAWLRPGDVDGVAAELAKRSRQRPLPADHSTTHLFESALEVAVSDGVLTPDELAMLRSLVVSAKLAQDERAAEEYVRMRARARGCRFDDAADEPPPLPASPTFTYSDGVAKIPGQTLAAIVQRVRSDPAAVHLVWRSGMSGWKRPSDVAELAAMLDSAE